MKQSNHDKTNARRRALGLLAAAAAACLAAGCGTLASEPAPDGYYRVQSGDTLYTVARRHKRSVRDLVRWNQLPSADRIEVGQLLRVRPPAGASAGTATANSRAVRSLEAVCRATDVPCGRLRSGSGDPAGGRPTATATLYRSADDARVPSTTIRVVIRTTRALSRSRASLARGVLVRRDRATRRRMRWCGRGFRTAARRGGETRAGDARAGRGRRSTRDFDDVGARGSENFYTSTEVSSPGVV